MELIANIGLWIAGVAFTIGGWFFKMIFGKIKEQEDKHDILYRQFEEHRLHVAQNYAPKDYIEKMENRLVSHLVRIEEKLDKKEDKK